VDKLDNEENPMNESDSNFDYDLRQIVLMEEQLSQFESGSLTLSHLVAGLKSLQNCLRTVNEDWKKNFVSEWWTLEQVHAVALDRQKTEFSSADLALLKEATANLRALTASAKEELKHSANE